MGKTELVKGSTEVILLSLLQQKEMYGYEIAKQIEEQSAGYLQFKEGTLYPALKRLELQNYVESYWKDSSDGPRRKYYRLTVAGEQSLDQLRTEWNHFQRTMNRIVGGMHGFIAGKA